MAVALRHILAQVYLTQLRGFEMPKNLKNRFRTELIRQRKNARKSGGREKLKKLHDGKYTDYSHIYSDRSYMAHLGRARKFADFCKEKGVRDFDQITP